MMVIAGDSLAANSIYKHERLDKKVFKKTHTSPNGIENFIYGFTTSFRMGQILQYLFNEPMIEDDKLNGDLFAYMVKDYIPALRACLKENWHNKIEETMDNNCGQFIVGFRDRLFTIHQDLQVAEVVDDYVSVGSGYEVALGSLYADSRPYFGSSRFIDIEEMAKRAIFAASNFIVSVGGDVNLVTLGY